MRHPVGSNSKCRKFTAQHPAVSAPWPLQRDEVPEIRDLHNLPEYGGMILVTEHADEDVSPPRDGQSPEVLHQEFHGLAIMGNVQDQLRPIRHQLKPSA